MAVTLNADIDLADVYSLIGGFAQAGGDLTPLMDQCGALLEGSTVRRLRETNQAPDGTEWLASGRVNEEGGKTLVDSGRLAASITHVPGPKDVRVGSNVLYAGIHQTGGTIVPKTAKALTFTLPGGQTVSVGKVTIPSRPYLGISSEDREDILDAALTHMAAFGDAQ